MSETVLLIRPCWWLTGQGGPPPPPLRGRPYRLTSGRGAAAPGPASTVSGNVSHCRGHVRGKKQQSFYKCTQKCIISFPPRDTKPEIRGHGKVVFHIAVEFTDYDEPFVRKSSESGQIGRTVQSAMARDGDKVEFACASGGEGPVLQFLGALGLNASPSTNRAMHDFVTKLALLSKM